MGMNSSHASHPNVDNSASHAAPVNSSTTQKSSTPYMLSQQKNLYSGSNQHSVESSHVSSNYSNPRPPSASNKPNIFKGYEEKERAEISYSSMEKKRTSNPTTHAEPDPYSKKYAVATNIGGPTMLTSQLGMGRDHGSQGTSSKYNAPTNYQLGASKSSQDKHPVSYGLGKSSHDSGTSAHPSKPTGSKYGLMNPNLNKQAFK